MKLAVMTRSGTLFRLICQCFEADGAICRQFDDDVALARSVYREEYSAILIDADTGMNPLRPVLARRACYADRRAPLIVVGARDDRADIAHLFDAGADDVVLSPVDSRELVLRVHLALRRFQPAPAAEADDRLECGAYRLERRTCEVLVDGEPVRLTSREFAIAWLLFSRSGEYVSRRQIAGAVWSSSEDIVGRTLEQHIYKLRKKLDLNGAHGVHLRTMYAHGYRIETVTVPVELARPMLAPEPLSATAGADTEIARVEAAPTFAMLSAMPSQAAPVAKREQAPRCALRETPHAEIHPADSETALNAPYWSNPATEPAFPACGSTAPQALVALWAAGRVSRGRGG
ncbi:response regulator transcription factor [Paraburkholderia ginsengiterrae]|uniref:DNA-binding response regulator n=1 Tax=Paraburkholderia ginsengiterrae TaxID=1462993 RepID=A0A1A9NBE0_9BURK|nr:response regulator transcription factor [Paraburkholderia ginsengiterrae]OAJ62855.1 DNA-binding response regulator [Paraburkholderia ginsengiterrae]